MKPIDFKGANVNMTKPEGMTEEQCGSMPVLHAIVDLGPTKSISSFTSCWELSDEDIDNILRERKVWLTILGQQPPVSLESSTPDIVNDRLDYLLTKEN